MSNNGWNHRHHLEASLDVVQKLPKRPKYSSMNGGQVKSNLGFQSPPKRKKLKKRGVTSSSKKMRNVDPLRRSQEKLTNLASSQRFERGSLQRRAKNNSFSEKNVMEEALTTPIMNRRDRNNDEKKKEEKVDRLPIPPIELEEEEGDFEDEELSLPPPTLSLSLGSTLGQSFSSRIPDINNRGKNQISPTNPSLLHYERIQSIGKGSSAIVYKVLQFTYVMF